MSAAPTVARPAERSMPPVTALCVASMALVIVGGIDMASHLPHRPPLGPAVGLCAGAGVLFLAALVTLSRVRPFAWGSFFLVARWALAAYLVIAGMLEFIFVFDHTRGATLVVMTLMLVLYALDIPVIIAFTVARYQPA